MNDRYPVVGSKNSVVPPGVTGTWSGCSGKSRVWLTVSIGATVVTERVIEYGGFTPSITDTTKLPLTSGRNVGAASVVLEKYALADELPSGRATDHSYSAIAGVVLRRISSSREYPPRTSPVGWVSDPSIGTVAE